MVAIYTFFGFNFHAFIGLSGDTIDSQKIENDLIHYECSTYYIDIVLIKSNGYRFRAWSSARKGPGPDAFTRQKYY